MRNLFSRIRHAVTTDTRVSEPVLDLDLTRPPAGTFSEETAAGIRAGKVAGYSLPAYGYGDEEWLIAASERLAAKKAAGVPASAELDLHGGTGIRHFDELHHLSRLDVADGVTLVGLPVRRAPRGEVIGRVVSERGSAVGLEVAGRIEQILGVDLGLQPWQMSLLDGLGEKFRPPPPGPDSLAPADVEAWRVAAGLPARLESTRRAEQLNAAAYRADLERLALESRWGSSAGRLAWSSFMAAGGGTITPWQAFEAGLKMAAGYVPGGLADDRPSGV